MISEEERGTDGISDIRQEAKHTWLYILLRCARKSWEDFTEEIDINKI